MDQLPEYHYVSNSFNAPFNLAHGSNSNVTIPTIFIASIICQRRKDLTRNLHIFARDSLNIGVGNGIDGGFNFGRRLSAASCDQLASDVFGNRR